MRMWVISARPTCDEIEGRAPGISEGVHVLAGQIVELGGIERAIHVPGTPRR